MPGEISEFGVVEDYTGRGYEGSDSGNSWQGLSGYFWENRGQVREASRGLFWYARGGQLWH